MHNRQLFVSYATLNTVKGTAAILSKKSLVLIFSYAPAGLGHLRVTDALYGGLPPEVSPLLLGSQAKTIEAIHRILSIHTIFRKLFEWGQSGPFQDLFTTIYVQIIRSQKKLMMQQMMTVLDQRIDVPKTVLVVATHYGLAHQLGAIKEKIEKQRNVRVILVVQVTDDSPQYIWYIPEADLTVVPSEYTKQKLIEYGKKTGKPAIPFEVVAYPVSPLLSTNLTDSDYHERVHQVDPAAKSQIHVSIPISGAAVGLDYFTIMIDHLYRTSHRFMFHITTRSAPYTLMFLRDMIERPYAKLYVSALDRQVVDMYEDVFKKYKISLEVTKPSEQSFKALLPPDQRGGTILLFSEPVGRQEYDNITFLRRNGLIPQYSDQQFLWERAAKRLPLIESKRGQELLTQARHWRGMELPKDPIAASCYIWWCFNQRLFTRMMQFVPPAPAQTNQREISPFGVKTFWQTVARYVEQQDDSCSTCP